MKKDPKIYVIIVTYKGRRWYDKCFDSLRKSTIPLQVVVVDNTPGKEDAEYIKSHFPEIHIIKTNENLGFGRANNLGMRYALDNGCDYVFLLNQDAWIEKDSISVLVDVASRHPEYAIISPMHMSADMQHINAKLKSEGDNYKLLSDLYTRNLEDVYTITYINAAAWLLPRRTLETIGGFCPLIYHYGEDDDYMNRLHYHGMYMGLVPSARIVHDCSETLENKQLLFDKANRENIDIFLNINNPTSIMSWRRYFLWMWIKGKLRRRDVTNFKIQYNILCAKQKEIEQCREAHKIKQANWL